MEIDASDIQMHRHASRVTAEGLRIFHDELRKVGFSDHLCDELTLAKYRFLLTPNVGAEMAEILKSISPKRTDDDDE